MDGRGEAASVAICYIASQAMAIRAILMLILAGTASADRVLVEHRWPSLREITIQVESAKFTPEYLMRICRTQLKTKPIEPFLRVEIFGDEGGSLLPKPSHFIFQSWLGLRRYKLGPYAELLAINGNAVLRMRDPEGMVSSRVIAGRNPLQISIGVYHYEIVHFDLRDWPGPKVEVYARTEAPLAPDPGIALLRALKPLFARCRSLSLYLRNDAWFVHEPNFPYLYPFESNEPRPIEEEYRKTLTLTCQRRGDNGPECSEVRN